MAEVLQKVTEEHIVSDTDRLRRVKARLKAIGGAEWRWTKGRKSRDEQVFMDHVARDMDWLIRQLEKQPDGRAKSIQCPRCFAGFYA